MSDSDDDSLAGSDVSQSTVSSADMSPPRHRQKREFRIVGDMKVDAEDYSNVLPLVRMIHQEVLQLHRDGDADGDPPSFDTIFGFLVRTQSRRHNHRIIRVGCMYYIEDEAESDPDMWDYFDLNLSQLPVSTCCLDHLQRLVLQDMPRLHAIPNDIGRLQKLSSLSICHVPSLTHLPDEMVMLEMLTALDVRNNTSLTRLPRTFPPNLVKFDSSGSPIQALPETIGNLRRLKTLSIDFHHLSGLPNSFMRLKRLEWLCTGYRRAFDFILSLPLSAFPKLDRLSTTTRNLANFDCKEHCPKQLELCCPLHPSEELGSFRQDLSRLVRWKKVDRMCLSISTDEEEIAQNHMLDADFFAGTLASFSKATDVDLNFYDSRDEGQRGTLRVYIDELEDLLCAEKLSLVHVTLRTRNGCRQERIRLPSLRKLDLSDCLVDYEDLLHLDFPNLVTMHLENYQNPDMTNEIFQNLCTEWLPNMPHLQFLSIGAGKLSKINGPAIDALSKLKLRHIVLEENPIVEGSVEDAEESLLPLVKACKLLGGGLDVVQSTKIDYQLLLNEGRWKLSQMRSFPIALWSKLFANGPKIFLHHAKELGYYGEQRERKMSDHDAIYTLLKERAALAIFGGST